MKQKNEFNRNKCNKTFKKKKSLSNHKRWHNEKKYKNFQESFKRKISNANTGEKNGVWKGKNVGYFALHEWVRRHKAIPQHCECCHIKKPFDLANKSGNYLRKVDDYEYLCRSCHMKKDRGIKN